MTGPICCAHPPELALSAGQSAWAITRLKYFANLAYPGVDPAYVDGCLKEAIASIEAVCGVTIDFTTDVNEANVAAQTGPIDGPWNVLALSELPPAQAQASTRLRQTFDIAETGLTRDQVVAMMAHEFMHCLGLGHAPVGSGNLMEPVLGAFKTPQAGDVAELQSRYGPVVPTPVPAPAPAPETVAIPVEDLKVTVPGGSLTLSFELTLKSATFTPAA